MSRIPDFRAVRFESEPVSSRPGHDWLTPESLTVKTCYWPDDMKGIDFLHTWPGAAPFLCGPYPTMYTTQPWTIRQYAGFSTAERNLELGHLDAVVARKDLREKVGNYLRLLGGGEEPDRGEGSEQRAGRSGRLAQATVERARTLATHARRPFVRGDREAPGRHPALHAGCRASA